MDDSSGARERFDLGTHGVRVALRLSGFVGGVERRGIWHVVIWDSFTTTQPPHPVRPHPARQRIVLETPLY